MTHLCARDETEREKRDWKQGEECNRISLIVKTLAVQSACRWATTATSYVIVNPSLDSTHHQHQYNEGRGEDGRDTVCAEQGRREDKTVREKREREVEGRREVAKIEQVCREEIRVLQVSRQDWYIDLRERGRQRGVEREFHYCEQCFEYHFKWCTVM